MELNYAQKRALYEDGYVKIPGVVPKVMITRALRSINASLGEGIDPAQLRAYRSRSYTPELQGAPDIIDLVNKTPALQLAESAIGQGQIQPIRAGQIAVRFPTQQDPPHMASPHLDGMHSADNGVQAGTIANFTALMGIFLSDVQTEFAGNFTVWPGSHRLYETYFREHGPESLLQGLPQIELPTPVQVLAEAGDLVICHYQLAHGVAGNAAPFPRYATFFRLFHEDHKQSWQEPMKNIWKHWPGIREIMTAPTTH